MTVVTHRKVLAMDALSCGAFFAGCVLFTGTAAELVGLPQVVVAVGGWICLAAGLLFAALALSSRPSPLLTGVGVLGNAMWVAASLMVVAVFAQQMTTAGIALVVGQAMAVGMLIWLEAMGLRSTTQAPAAA